MCNELIESRCLTNSCCSWDDGASSCESAIGSGSTDYCTEINTTLESADLSFSATTDDDATKKVFSWDRPTPNDATEHLGMSDIFARAPNLDWLG